MEEDRDGDEDVDDDDDDEKKANSFLALFAFCVRWVEDVCVRGVGSRERAVVGSRTCGRRRCTRV